MRLALFRALSRSLATLLLVILAGACGVEGMPRRLPPNVVSQPDCDVLHTFDARADWKAADAVAIARVESESVRRHAPSSAGYTSFEERDLGIESILTREIDLRVESVLAGLELPSGPFRIQDARREERTGRPERWITCGDTWLEVGDRVLIALWVSPRDPGKVISYTNGSLLFLDDGQVVDTDRTKPVIRELERLTEAELIEIVRREAQ